jgi:hypothetical protein
MIMQTHSVQIRKYLRLAKRHGRPIRPAKHHYFFFPELPGQKIKILVADAVVTLSATVFFIDHTDFSVTKPHAHGTIDIISFNDLRKADIRGLRCREIR